MEFITHYLGTIRHAVIVELATNYQNPSLSRGWIKKIWGEMR